MPVLTFLQPPSAAQNLKAKKVDVLIDPKCENLQVRNGRRAMGVDETNKTDIGVTCYPSNVLFLVQYMRENLVANASFQKMYV